MAEHADVAAYRHGAMPIKDHTDTYRGAMGLFKWGALGVADLLILLTFWFCTPAGFFTGAVVSVIVLGLGIVGLKSRKSAEH